LKGIYVLIVKINKTISVNIGALGLLKFPGGLYAYVGSAQNNFEQRVKRHQSKEKRLFWHIDYLLNDEAANVIGVYYTQGEKAKECKIAGILRENVSQLLVSDAQTAAVKAIFSSLKTLCSLKNACIS